MQNLSHTESHKQCEVTMQTQLESAPCPGLWIHHTKHTKKTTYLRHMCRPLLSPANNTHTQLTLPSVQTAILKCHHKLGAQNHLHTESHKQCEITLLTAITYKYSHFAQDQCNPTMSTTNDF